MPIIRSSSPLHLLHLLHPLHPLLFRLLFLLPLPPTLPVFLLFNVSCARAVTDRLIFFTKELYSKLRLTSYLSNIYVTSWKLKKWDKNQYMQSTQPGRKVLLFWFFWFCNILVTSRPIGAKSPGIQLTMDSSIFESLGPINSLLAKLSKKNKKSRSYSGSWPVNKSISQILTLIGL